MDSGTKVYAQKTYSVEDVFAMFRATDEQFRATDERMAKENAALRQYLKELGERSDEETRKLNQEIREIQRETAMQIKENGELQKETYRQLKEQVKDLNKRMGGMTNTFGTWVESFFEKSTLEMFKRLGYSFDNSGNRKFYAQNSCDCLTEVDNFLENGEYVMAVEVKSSFTNVYVKEHLERLAIIREIFDKKGDKRTILGAVASMSFGGGCDKLAIKEGLYVIKQTGENVNLEDTPVGWRPREF